jgi:hypothetical protein
MTMFLRNTIRGVRSFQPKQRYAVDLGLARVVTSSGSAAGVGAALFGRGDAFALAFQDQGAFKLGEGAHDRQQQGGHRGVLAGEEEVLLDELHPHAFACPDALAAARSASAARCCRQSTNGGTTPTRCGQLIGARPVTCTGP